MPKKFKSAKEKREWEEHQKWLASHSKHIRTATPKREALKLDLGSTPRDVTRVTAAPSHKVIMSMDATAKHASPKYSGTLITGIATMHKSNAIPILNQQQAIEVSTMRRN